MAGWRRGLRPEWLECRRRRRGTFCSWPLFQPPVRLPQAVRPQSRTWSAVQWEEAHLMRAFAHESFGDPGSIREVDLPHPSANEVRIKVIAASVNPVDWKTGKGYLKDYLEHRFPLILGQDVAGIVDSVGAHVHDLKEGDEVFGGHGQMFMGR